MAREDGTPVCDCDGGILSISVGNILNGNLVGKLSCRKCGKLVLQTSEYEMEVERNTELRLKEREVSLKVDWTLNLYLR